MKKSVNMPVCKTMCKTCPFRAGSPYAHLEPTLREAAMTEGRICHSTGSNAINKKTGKPSHLCRGARQIQLQLMHRLKVIAAPTDAAWNAKRVQMGMKPQEIRNPV